ncbi:MAG TPA: hypothetical protein VEU11_18990 [Terriglobales bacterium]|jgi:Ni/Fe-hydrogenase subunit HybB-like protein|nr:hypothetical protein [Terriglobales bacterium]
MLSIIVAIVAGFAIVIGQVFIFSKTLRSMPRSKVLRFVLLFALSVPLEFVVNYVNVRTLGYHKMSWAGAFMIALVFAAWGTFLPPQPHNTNTQ